MTYIADMKECILCLQYEMTFRPANWVAIVPISIAIHTFIREVALA